MDIQGSYVKKFIALAPRNGKKLVIIALFG